MIIVKRILSLILLGLLTSINLSENILAQTKSSELIELSIKLNREQLLKSKFSNNDNLFNLIEDKNHFNTNLFDLYINKPSNSNSIHPKRSSRIIAHKPRLPKILSQSDLGALQSTQTDAIKTNGSSLFNIEANGWNIGLWDAGNPLETHQEFGNRIQIADTNLSITINSHATSVASSAIANGTNTDAIGAASEANIQSYDWNNDESEMAYAAANELKLSVHPYVESTGWYYNWFNDNRWVWYADTSMSTSENTSFGYYSEQAKNWDEIAYLAPLYLIVKAVGNFRGIGPENQPTEHWVPYYDENSESWEWNLSTSIRDINGGISGYESLSHSALAKNILSIASTFKLNSEYTQASDVLIGSNSSFGPTDDGRIKPDISVPGQNLNIATSSSNTSYAISSGTSYASGLAAGILANLQSFYTDLHTKNPRSSMLKALVIQTADEAGDFDGPDYKFGWGLLNSERAARLLYNFSISNPLVFLADTSISNGETIEFLFNPYSYSEVKATLCWTDPAGTLPPYSLNPSNSILVNDLDIRIYDEELNEYLPWKLDRANPSSAAIKADNSIDNIEQISLNNSSGLLIVRITHKETLTASQKFSLIVSAGEPSSSQTISGDAGWRLLSYPQNISISQVSEQSYVQGIDGLLYGSTFNSNIYTSFSNGVWGQPLNSSDVIEKGKGYIQYFYNNNFTTNSELPIHLFTGTIETRKSVIVNLEQTGRKFTMIGNPFSRSIRFDELQTLNGDITDIGWKWDPINGWFSISQLEQDLINPHEGFFLETIDADQLVIPFSARQLNNENLKNRVNEDLKFYISLRNANPYSSKDTGVRIKHLADDFQNPKIHLTKKPSPLHYNFAELNLHLPENDLNKADNNEFFQIPLLFKNKNIVQVYLSLKTTQTGLYTIQTDFPSKYKETILVSIEDSSKQQRRILHSDDSFTIEITDKNLRADKIYYSENLLLTFEETQTTSIERVPLVNSKEIFITSSVAPNPFNPITSFQLNVLEPNHFLIQLYSITGKLIQTLSDSNLKTGNYSFSVNGNNLSSGIYIIRVSSKNKKEIKKITLIK